MMKSKLTLIFVFLVIGQSAMANVFTPDERRLVKDAKTWQAVGRLNTKSGGYCTASLVAPSIILTAAHCFYDLRTGKPTSDSYEFHAGYKDGSAIASAKVINHWVGTKKIGKNSTSATDWALARLDQALGDQLGYFPIGSLDFSTDMDAKTLTQVAYHYDLGEGHAAYIQQGCSMRAQMRDASGKNETALVDCDATQGASGSGIFKWDPTRRTYVITAIFVLELGATEGHSQIDIPFLINDANEVVPLGQVELQLRKIQRQ